MKTKQCYKLTFTPISPIHIGTGDEIDPLEYVIRQTETGVNRLYRINLSYLIESLSVSKRSELLRLLDGSDMVVVRDFVQQNVNPAEHCFYNAVVTDVVSDLYKRFINNPQNRLRINSFYRRHDTWQAVVPGASIKGAIRTAILSPRIGSMPSSLGFGWELKYLQAHNPYDDPFRALQISDVDFPNDAVIVDRTAIIRCKRDTGTAPEKIQQFYEMLFCELNGQTNKGTGMLSFSTGLQQKTILLQMDKEMIIRSCKEFYLPKAEEEYQKFYQKNSDGNIKNVAEKLQDFLNNLQDNEFPIRLGHFSHCEAMTVDKYRQPKTRHGSGATRTLAGGCYPMGWAKVTLD